MGPFLFSGGKKEGKKSVNPEIRPLKMCSKRSDGSALCAEKGATCGGKGVQTPSFFERKNLHQFLGPTEGEKEGKEGKTPLVLFPTLREEGREEKNARDRALALEFSPLSEKGEREQPQLIIIQNKREKKRRRKKKDKIPMRNSNPPARSRADVKRKWKKRQITLELDVVDGREKEKKDVPSSIT